MNHDKGFIRQCVEKRTNFYWIYLSKLSCPKLFDLKGNVLTELKMRVYFIVDFDTNGDGV